MIHALRMYIRNAFAKLGIGYGRLLFLIYSTCNLSIVLVFYL